MAGWAHGWSSRTSPWVALAAVLVSSAGASCRMTAPPPGRKVAFAPSAPAAASAPASAVSRDAINPRLLRRFRPIARLGGEAGVARGDLVSLGRMLWYESRLSRSGKLSCNGCHDLDDAGVDHRPTSLGDRGQRGRRNAPTIYNSAGHVAEFWDGRATSLESQAAGPILSPLEMSSTREAVVQTLASIPGYQSAFRSAFPGERFPVTFEHVTEALAAFERGLVTKSRWEAFLAGNRAALTPDEIRGLRVFLQVGCVGCHTGPQVGASMFQVAGLVEPWPNQRDQGRFEVTGLSRDRMVFKVPTMKNVALTAPYFHDGSCDDLPTAVRVMGRHQLGIELTDHEVTAIVAFLGALSGDVPRDYIARPSLPGYDDATGVE